MNATANAPAAGRSREDLDRSTGVIFLLCLFLCFLAAMQLRVLGRFFLRLMRFNRRWRVRF